MSLRILIVDDALIDRQHLEHILVAAGHRVLLAESGEQALVRARDDRPDVILMDVNMPDLDGFATTRRLKADAATRDIPVVLVTSKDQKADKAWGQMLGAKGYVTKPYTDDQVLSQLRAL